MTKTLPALIVAAALGAGCASTHLYKGAIEAPDSAGTLRTMQLSWYKTRSFLWFKQSADPILVQAACSDGLLKFVDTESGIVFRKRQGIDVAASSQDVIPDLGVCGTVGSDPSLRLKQLGEGELKVEMLCRPVKGTTVIAGKRFVKEYLAPGTYTFHIKRHKVASIPLDDPPPPPCRGD